MFALDDMMVKVKVTYNKGELSKAEDVIQCIMKCVLTCSLAYITETEITTISSVTCKKSAVTQEIAMRWQFQHVLSEVV